MSQVIILLYLTALFVALTPGILLTLPPKGSKIVVAIIHAIIFAIILCFTYNEVYSFANEGFTPVTDSANIVQPCQNGTSGANGTCLTCNTGYRLNENSLCVPIIF
jgi:ABC-type uncharacterized transport system permease subunit